MLGRYAGDCRLLLVVLKTLDSLVEGIDRGDNLPRGWGRFLGQESACKKRKSTR
jgi:hypothetical protein